MPSSSWQETGRSLADRLILLPLRLACRRFRQASAGWPEYHAGAGLDRGSRKLKRLEDGLALDPRNDSTNQPTFHTEFNRRNQSLMLIQGHEGLAEVIFRLRHGALHRLLGSDDDAISSPPAPYHLISKV